MADAEWDEEKLAEAALALLSLTLHDGDRARRGIDRRVMARLHERGWISDPADDADSLRMSPSGLRKARAVLQKKFSKRKVVPAPQPHIDDPAEAGDMSNVLVIRCTAKLLAELRVKPRDVPPGLSPNRDWHATLIHTKRRKSVLVSHTSTLYTVLLFYVNRAVLDAFGAHFVSQARAVFSWDDLPDHEAVLPAGPPRILYAKTNNRSVVGSMRDLAFQVEVDLEHLPAGGTVDLQRAHKRINRVPMIGTLGGAYSVEAMSKLLASS